MQVQCSQCSTRIQIEDAKVPDRPFKLKCPRCQTVLSLAGRGAGGPVERPRSGPAAGR